MFCLGYLSGASDMISAIGPENPRVRANLCMPTSGLSNETLRAIFNAYIRNHPELRAQSARLAILGALLEVFRCRNAPVRRPPEPPDANPGG